jgi:hypothetical protein
MCPMEPYWQPILLSAVFCFVASSIIHMALPIHKHEYKKLGDKERTVMEAVRSWGLGGGVYYFPYCDPKTRNDPANKEKMAAGPWGMMMLWGTKPNMGKLLALWFLNLLIVSTLVAYVGRHAGLEGKPYLKVFQVIGAVSFLAYGGNMMTDCIWKGRGWNSLPGALFDALVYSCLTGGTFGWLLPKMGQ